MTYDERVEGWVVDMACLRRYALAEYRARAMEHSTECALMGHCVESGYGVVDAVGSLVALDTEATPYVVAALRACSQESGVRLQVERQSRHGEMMTTTVRHIT
ncbi:hypothetical protein V5H98_07855 [Georgenia sp. M64]|uniref:hypothetical protein n=1 Tax=Georgenia sp. M64 TaxID=3120520 RepID=UPI0030E402C5